MHKPTTKLNKKIKNQAHFVFKLKDRIVLNENQRITAVNVI
jgi:hypothetical protein